jgi:hypothetical protein
MIIMIADQIGRTYRSTKALVYGYLNKNKWNRADSLVMPILLHGLIRRYAVALVATVLAPIWVPLYLVMALLFWMAVPAEMLWNWIVDVCSEFVDLYDQLRAADKVWSRDNPSDPDDDWCPGPYTEEATFKRLEQQGFIWER